MNKSGNCTCCQSTAIVVDRQMYYFYQKKKQIKTANLWWACILNHNKSCFILILRTKNVMCVVNLSFFFPTLQTMHCYREWSQWVDNSIPLFDEINNIQILSDTVYLFFLQIICDWKKWICNKKYHWQHPTRPKTRLIQGNDTKTK